MRGRFGPAWARLRADAGFPTAYAFYHRNGGRRVFPFGYAYYRQVELGESLPRGAWLPGLVERLRVPPEPDALHALLTDYLRDKVGAEDVFARLFAPMLHGPGAAPPQSRALSRILRRGACQHTPEEFRALLSTPAVYWSHVYLTLAGRGSGLSPKELAAAAGLGEDAVRAGLAALVGRGLARPARGGRFRGALAGVVEVLPRGYPGWERDVRTLERYWSERMRRGGAPAFDMGVVLRGSPAAMHEAAASLRRVLECLAAVPPDEGGREDVVFAVQARVRSAGAIVSERRIKIAF